MSHQSVCVGVCAQGGTGRVSVFTAICVCICECVCGICVCGFSLAACMQHMRGFYFARIT